MYKMIRPQSIHAVLQPQRPIRMCIIKTECFHLSHRAKNSRDAEYNILDKKSYKLYIHLICRYSIHIIRI